MYLQEELQCWRRIEKRRCRGSITAYTPNENSPIEWFCWDCCEGGIISEWQNTIFDQSAARAQAEFSYVERGIWVEDHRLDEITLDLGSIHGRGRSLRRFSSQDFLLRELSTNQLRLELPAAALLEMYRRKILSPQQEIIKLRQGFDKATKFKLVELFYDGMGTGVVLLLENAVKEN